MHLLIKLFFLFGSSLQSRTSSLSGKKPWRQIRKHLVKLGFDHISDEKRRVHLVVVIHTFKQRTNQANYASLVVFLLTVEMQFFHIIVCSFWVITFENCPHPQKAPLICAGPTLMHPLQHIHRYTQTVKYMLYTESGYWWPDLLVNLELAFFLFSVKKLRSTWLLAHHRELLNHYWQYKVKSSDTVCGHVVGDADVGVLTPVLGADLDIGA